MFHCTDPNTAPCFTACAGREARKHQHSAATNPRKSTLSPRGTWVFIVITTLPTAANHPQPHPHQPPPPPDTAAAKNSTEVGWGRDGGDTTPYEDRGPTPSPCSIHRILLHPQPKSHCRHRPALSPSMGKYPQQCPPQPEPQAGDCLNKTFLQVFILGGSWDGSNSHGWGGGGSQLGPELLYLKALAAARRPSSLAQGSVPKTTTQTAQQQQRRIRRNTHRHQHRTDGSGMLRCAETKINPCGTMGAGWGLGAFLR